MIPASSPEHVLTMRCSLHPGALHYNHWLQYIDNDTFQADPAVLFQAIKMPQDYLNWQIVPCLYTQDTVTKKHVKMRDQNNEEMLPQQAIFYLTTSQKNQFMTAAQDEALLANAYNDPKTFGQLVMHRKPLPKNPAGISPPPFVSTRAIILPPHLPRTLHDQKVKDYLRMDISLPALELLDLSEQSRGKLWAMSEKFSHGCMYPLGFVARPDPNPDSKKWSVYCQSIYHDKYMLELHSLGETCLFLTELDRLLEPKIQRDPLLNHLYTTLEQIKDFNPTHVSKVTKPQINYNDSGYCMS